MRPRFSSISRPSNKGRRECRATDAPDSRVCNGSGRSAHALVRSHRNHPAFPTQWFTDYSALSPVLRAFWPPSSASLHANLTPASGCQDHTPSPSASAPFVKGPSASTASRPAFSDDRETPLIVGRDREQYRIIRIFCKAEYFFWRSLTTQVCSGTGTSEVICPTTSRITRHHRA